MNIKQLREFLVQLTKKINELTNGVVEVGNIEINKTGWNKVHVDIPVKALSNENGEFVSIATLNYDFNFRKQKDKEITSIILYSWITLSQKLVEKNNELTFDKSSDYVV